MNPEEIRRISRSDPETIECAITALVTQVAQAGKLEAQVKELERQLKQNSQKLQQASHRVTAFASFRPVPERREEKRVIEAAYHGTAGHVKTTIIISADVDAVEVR
ncbi:hypothetical protein D3C76_445610 [compost metagenome]